MRKLPYQSSLQFIQRPQLLWNDIGDRKLWRGIQWIRRGPTVPSRLSWNAYQSNIPKPRSGVRWKHGMRRFSEYGNVASRMTIILQTTRKLAALLLLIATRIAPHLPSCCRFPQGRSNNCPKKISFCTYRRSSEALLCGKPEFRHLLGYGKGGDQKKNENSDFGDTFGEVGGWHSHSCQTCFLVPLPHPTQIRNK